MARFDAVGRTCVSRSRTEVTSLSKLAGEWFGHISGTNAGSVAIQISERGSSLDGTIVITDREFGKSRFLFVGKRDDDRFELAITPLESPNGVLSAAGTVIGKLKADGEIAGFWETELGTAGRFTATPRGASMDPGTPDAPEVKGPQRRSAMTPLWVISLFVSLCEVVAGLAVSQATGGVQVTLTVFVVLFPVLVAAAFFAILWKKPYVFYPPTEFGGATNVSEYVQALGGLSPSQAAERQLALIGGSAKASPAAAEIARTATSPPETAEDQARAELASIVRKYFAFKRMRFSDVSTPDTRAVFAIGAYQGFNLFDGVPGVTFFGHFPELAAAEIVARVRFLLNNIEASYKRVAEQPDSPQRDAAIRILDQLSIEVLVANNAPVDQIHQKIEAYRPTDVRVPVEIHPESEIRSMVEREYASMGL